MACLLGCFGRRKNRRRQKRRESFQPRFNRIAEVSTKDVHSNLTVPVVEKVPNSVKGDQINLSVPAVVEVYKISDVSTMEDDHLNSMVPAVEEVPKISVISIKNNCDKAEVKYSKRVTFDSNVKTYEHIVVEEESLELEVKSLKCMSSEGSDVTSNSSSGSYPLNHRYQNCRESDDEEEDVTDCDESDLEDIDDDDDDDDEMLHEDYSSEEDNNYEDKLHKWDKEVYNTEEIADNVMDIESLEEYSRGCARDRSGYVNSVLNPIENLTQWKAVKSKGRRATQTLSRKENTVNASFGLEPQVEDDLSSSSSISLNQKSRDETKKQRTQEVAVDASLSTWLSTTSSVETAMHEHEEMKHTSKSNYSKLVQSHDERPILGALTSEEIKQFSATNSPRKSPSRSPESPIIGTVGGYWNSHSMATSKYSRGS